jgi:hypothetical protein
MRHRIVLTVLAALPGVACSESLTGSGPHSLCALVQGAEVCAARSEYRPGDVVTITIHNRGTETLRVDACSIKVVGKTTEKAVFAEDYAPNIQCGVDWTIADILENMVEIAPGESVTESTKIQVFAFQGYYRVNVWLVDETGMRTAAVPAYSGTFEVYPSAGS